MAYCVERIWVLKEFVGADQVAESDMTQCLDNTREYDTLLWV